METGPYKCHVFVCVNDRHGQSKSCADGASPALHLALKQRLQEKGLPPSAVRVSRSLCMGLCETGPNVVIYPQDIRISEARIEDVERIVVLVETLLAVSE